MQPNFRGIFVPMDHLNGLMQERRNSSALAHQFNKAVSRVLSEALAMPLTLIPSFL